MYKMTLPIRFLFVVAVLFSASIVLSCRKEKSFPIIPEITFKKIDVYEVNKFIITIGFTDGDGDIGFRPKDTLPPFDTSSVYYHNCFTKFYEKQNGVFTELSFFIPYNYRIPSVTPDERNKNISGDIDLKIDGFFPSKTNDTLMVELYIVDRDLHHSNTIFTTEFVLNVQ